MHVDSPFAKLSLRETVDFLCGFVSLYNFRLPIPVEYIRNLILSCTVNTHFNFERETFKQIGDEIMGSHLGPYLTDVFFGVIEQKVVGSILKTSVYRC